MKKFFNLLVFLAFTFSFCKEKSSNDEHITNPLVGKWQHTERFDGYVNGGNFRWNSVESDNSHTLEFSRNGQYVRQNGSNSNNSRCVGTYVLRAENKLEITSDCNTVVLTNKISELSPTVLIIDVQGFEGTIRYKYVKK